MKRFSFMLSLQYLISEVKRNDKKHTAHGLEFMEYLRPEDQRKAYS